MRRQVEIGRSQLGRAITAWHFIPPSYAKPRQAAILFGAIHGDEPLGVYWYELKRGLNPEWIKHAITYDEGIGAGLSIPVVDMDGDGDPAIVVTGKFGGPVWFENKRIDR